MNNPTGLLGFAPGTFAIWAAMLFGVSCALAYLRSMRAARTRPAYYQSKKILLRILSLRTFSSPGVCTTPTFFRFSSRRSSS